MAGEILWLIYEENAIGITRSRHTSIIPSSTLEFVQKEIIDWFETHGRKLPWREPGFTPWGQLVSEFMLQQTPVARVIPKLERWLELWPSPEALATSPVADALREWGNLGYPRRALWLHACAVKITETFGGEVPSEVSELLTLPGVGPYTARAIAVFSFGAHEPVVDTNIRRVIARYHLGLAGQGPPQEKYDLEVMTKLLPSQETSPVFNAGMMELGALICTARNPQCEECPIKDNCAWRISGYPATNQKKKPVQKKYEGSDRQARGAIMKKLRESPHPVTKAELIPLWNDTTQLERAMMGLLGDGLIELVGDDIFQLPA